MDELKKELASKWKEQKDALDTAMATTVSKEDYNTLLASVKTQGQEMANYIEMNKVAIPEDFESKFETFLSENKDELAKIAKNKTGEIEFIFDSPNKVVGDMATDSGGDFVAAPPNHNTQLNRIRFRDDNPLITMCNVVRTSKSSFSYTETSPKDGDYAFVAEAGTKPQIDFSWLVRYAEPFKIAAHMVFSEEVVRDIPRMMDTARGLLKDKHDLFKADAIYFADGTGGSPVGASAVARTFVAGDMALSIPSPTIIDAINAILTDVYITPNYADETPFMPNLVLLNPVDFFIYLQAEKNSRNEAMFPGITLFNQFNMGNVAIRPWHKVPAGKLFVGDMKKYNISNWVRYSVRIGWINDQFITNQFTMVGESRSHYFVKNFDEMGFVYDDIDTVITAITKP